MNIKVSKCQNIISTMILLIKIKDAMEYIIKTFFNN